MWCIDELRADEKPGNAGTTQSLFTCQIGFALCMRDHHVLTATHMYQQINYPSHNTHDICTHTDTYTYIHTTLDLMDQVLQLLQDCLSTSLVRISTIAINSSDDKIISPQTADSRPGSQAATHSLTHSLTHTLTQQVSESPVTQSYTYAM